MIDIIRNCMIFLLWYNLNCYDFKVYSLYVLIKYDNLNNNCYLII